MFRKAIAVTGIAAGILAAGAGAAFAGTPAVPPANLTLNATVPTTISIALSTGNTPQNVTLTPGTPMDVFPGALAANAFLVETATNDGAGYSDTVTLPSGPLTAGSSTISEANTSALVWSNPATLTGGDVAFSGATPITLWTTSGPSGNFGAGTPGGASNGALFSSAGTDYLSSNIHVSAPGNQAGGVYTATFRYDAIAN